MYYIKWPVLHQMGWNKPIVSKKQAKKYLDKIEQTYQDIDYKDDWEKYICIGYYYLIKAWYEWTINDDIHKAIKFQLKCIEVRSNIPEDGEFYSAMGAWDLGFYYSKSGDFEEAEISYNLILKACKKYDNLYQLWPLISLSWLNFIKGNLQKAKELIVQRLDVAKRYNNTYGIFGSLSQNGFYLFQEGNYDEAIKAHKESLVYRKQHGDPLQIFWGYYWIFEFEYQRFIITKDEDFFNQAEQTLADLLELGKTHSDNKTIVNYTNYTQALILKFGSIRKKAKAIDILEKLVDTYPNDIGISLNLLELLFEDFLLSEDQDTINQIDELMEKIDTVPLRNNPEAISSFVSQQIFLAKYIFYIKGDISVAINILHSTTDHVKQFKINNLEQMLEAETQILEQELTKWENADITIKERIKASQFNKYIQQALIYVDQQKSID